MLCFYLLVLCVYTFSLLIRITKQRNGLLTTLLIVILLKRLFYNFTIHVLYFLVMDVNTFYATNQTYTTWKWWTFNYYVYFIITVNTYLFKYVPVKLGFIILSIIGVLRIPEEFYLYKDKEGRNRYCNTYFVSPLLKNCRE